MNIYPKILLLPLAETLLLQSSSSLLLGVSSKLRCCRNKKHLILHNSASSRSAAFQISKGNNNENDDEQQTHPSSSTTTPTTEAAAKALSSRQSLLGSLLEKTTSRAFRTLTTGTDNTAYHNGGLNDNRKSVKDVIEIAFARSSSILDHNNNEHHGSNDKRDEYNESSSSSGKQQGQFTNDVEHPIYTKPVKHHHHDQDKRTYLGNPSVTPTALAHSLWQSTILPYQDTIIDATCGNGKDCLALTKLLFPNNNSASGDEEVKNQKQNCDAPQPQLIGIDIQARAIANTQRSLLSTLPSHIYYNHVSLLHQSHEHLMNVPTDTRSVGLVCYNLGYLPGGGGRGGNVITDQSNSYKECQTQTQTTLNSITDASLLVRVGGLVSIMTYPGSNLEESRAVEHFAEGLAMLSTRDVGGWRGYVDAIPNYDDESVIREMVSRAMERVVADGSKKNKTWRVFVHKPLGRPLSPVLVTAMRIK